MNRNIYLFDRRAKRYKLAKKMSNDDANASLYSACLEKDEDRPHHDVEHNNKDDPSVQVISNQRCDWKYVVSEVRWYLTTDETCALPLLCLGFIVVPSLIVRYIFFHDESAAAANWEVLYIILCRMLGLSIALNDILCLHHARHSTFLSRVCVGIELKSTQTSNFDSCAKTWLVCIV